MEFIFRLPLSSLFIFFTVRLDKNSDCLFIFFTLRLDKKFESSSIFFSLLVTLLVESILLLCLVLAEKSKPCLQFYLPKFALLFLIYLSKIKTFKKSTRIMANI